LNPAKLNTTLLKNLNIKKEFIMRQYKIKKVKLVDENKIEISFYKLNPKLPDSEPIAEFTMKSSRLSSRGLQDSVTELLNDFRKLCELDKVDAINNFVGITEIRFSYDDEEKGLGIQIVGYMNLYTHIDALEIKTPKLWENPANELEQIPGNLFNLLVNVQLECYEYIEQEKKQFELFDAA